MALKSDFEFDDNVHPTKGGNRPTDFLRANFKILGKGGSFRTVKKKFPAKVIEAVAEKSGALIKIKDEDPWLLVMVTGRVPPKPKAKKQDIYTGAGKEYPEAPDPAPTFEPDTKPEPDIFS